MQRETSFDHGVDRVDQPDLRAADDSAQRVLRNTYRLLAMTLAFSGATAIATAALGVPGPGFLLTLGGYFALLFVTARLRNSPWGLVSVFGLTGFMGYTIGPLLNFYLARPDGPTIVATAMGLTALIFLGLSAYARRTDSINLLNAGSFLFIGILTAFGLGLAAIFFNMPALGLAVSAIFVLLMSGLILYETQNIVSGGERNYIMATITLFVSIFNLFTSLMHLLVGGEEA